MEKMSNLLHKNRDVTIYPKSFHKRILRNLSTVHNYL